MSFRRIHGVLALLTIAVLGPGCARTSREAPPQPLSEPRLPVATKPASPSTTEPEKQIVFDLIPAFFDFDSYSLRPDARSALDHNARKLREQLGLQIVIEGHCDERGTTEYNLALGERRALSARDYLLNAGIAPSRIHIVSYGKERPFSPGRNEAAWSQNRRAHVVTR